MRSDMGIDPTAKEAYLSDVEFEKVGGWWAQPAVGGGCLHQVAGGALDAASR